MNKKILEILKANEGSFISGEEFSKELNVTRAAIWKHIENLRESGYVIESVSKKGYRLQLCPDLLTGDEIYDKLDTKYVGRNVVHFEQLDSTSSHAKKISDSCPDGTVVTCEKQIAGRGRLGRKWEAVEGSLYMSLVLKPDISIFEAAKLTQVCAAAVSEALDAYGVKTQIKWPNDILINGKKICGILTEMNSEINKVNYVVVGIGINVNNKLEDFSEDLRNTVTSIAGESGSNHKRNDVAASVINCFEKYYTKFVDEKDYEYSLKMCRERSSVIGKYINVIRADGVKRAKAADIGLGGELIVMYEDGTEDKLISGEVSVRVAE